MSNEGAKSVVLVAHEAAVAHMQRTVSDHGTEGSVRREIVDAWREAAERDFLERLDYHLRQGELRAISQLNGAPYNPRLGGTPPSDAMWLLSSEEQAKALELLGQQAPDTRLTFKTLARPLQVPAVLRLLPPDEQILTRADFGGSTGTVTARAGEYIKYIEDILQRQAEHIFTVSEAAQVLVDSRPGADVRQMLEKMHRAYREGKLTIRDPGDGLPKVIVDFHRDYFDIVKVADVDAWLEAVGAGYRFPNAAQLPASEIARPTTAPASVFRHSTKPRRRDTLDPVIELAQSQCRDPKDTAQVWAQLAVLAQEEQAPLLAATPQGLKYTKKGEAAYFQRGALHKRLHPETRKKSP